MHEHRLVIEHIFGTELQRLGSFPNGAPTVERIYGAFKHLYTPLRVQT